MLNVQSDLTNFYIPRITDLPNPEGTAAILNRPIVADYKGALAEAILFADRVTIDLGSSAVPTIIEWFGESLFEEVLDAGKISFTFTKPIADAGYVSLYLGNKIGSKPGLVIVQVKGNEFNTPFGRAKESLSDQTGYPKWKVRRFARLVERDAVIFPDSVYKVAHAAAREDIVSTVGSELFFPKGVNPSDGTLAEPDVRKLLAVAGANVKLAIAAELGLNRVIGDETTRLVMRQRLGDLTERSTASLEDVLTLLEVEGVPNLGALMATGALTFKDVVDLSYTSEAEAFRAWLRELDIDSRTDVARAYAAEVRTRSHGTLATRTLRIAASTLGGLLLAPFDPTGLASGATVNTVAEFYGDRLGRTWKPRLFIDHLRDI